MINKLVQELLEYMPSLNLSSENEREIVVEGEYNLDATIQGFNIKKSFQLKVLISKKFPEVLPKIYDIGGEMKGFHHLNYNGEFCLSVFLECYLRIQNNPTIKNYFVELVNPFLFSYEFYVRYNEMPFGERSHGADGIYEFYKDYLETEDMYQTAKLLYFIVHNTKYRGHLPCPCGSGKQTRNCHAKKLKEIFDKKSVKAYAILLTKDMKEIMNKCQKQK